MTSNFARMFAASARHAVLQNYTGNGDAVGFEIAQRTIWELGDVIADVHGKRKAAEAMYRIADAIVDGTVPEPITLPAPESVQPAARPTPSPPGRSGPVRFQLFQLAVANFRADMREHPGWIVWTGAWLGFWIGFTLRGI